MPADTMTAASAAPAPSGAPGGPVRPSTRVRRFWMVGGSLLVVLAVPFNVIQTVTQLAHEEHTEVHEFDAADVRSIEVHSANGNVRVVGDSDEGGTGGAGTITVTARVSEGFRSTGHSERIEGDRLVLASTCPIVFSSFCEVSYTVETPPDVDVVVRSDRGSTVEGIDGDVEVSSDEGSVELARIGGTLRVDTDQGGVRATGLRSTDVEASSDQGEVLLRFADEPRRVAADSDQGDVEVVLPEGPALYRVTTDSDQGSVERDIRTDPDSDRSITATTDQGNVILRYP